jgi:energy-coupling factor transporter ATP-binding protein EcfA2
VVVVAGSSSVRPQVGSTVSPGSTGEAVVYKGGGRLQYRGYLVVVDLCGNFYCINVVRVGTNESLPTCLVSRYDVEGDLKYCVELPPPNNIPPELANVVLNYLRSLSKASNTTAAGVDSKGNPKEPVTIAQAKEIEHEVRGKQGSEVTNTPQNTQQVNTSTLQVREVDVKTLPLLDRVKYLCENIWDLIPKKLGISQEDFKKSRVEDKAAMVYRLISEFFEFVRVPPLETKYVSNYFVVDGNVLWDVGEVTKPIAGALIKFGLARRSLAGELETAIASTGNLIPWEYIDPWDHLNLVNGVLDLHELKIMSNSRYYFRYKLDISITQEEIDAIKNGSYKIEDNEVYKLWRNHFDDQNWEYLIHSLGTILAPFKFKHIMFLIGPTGVGKSTLLDVLSSPIRPLITSTSLRLITNYQFGLEDLIGKQVVMYSERGDVVLKNLDIINNLVGERDTIAVPRKFKSTVHIRSLKTMIFAMNDPPILYEYGGETLQAFIDRLSIVLINRPENFTPRKDIYVDPKEVFKFLLWCRVKLENNGWVIKKMENEEIIEYLLKTSNPVLRFLESEYVEVDPTARVKGTELYDAYTKWCSENGITPMDRNKFYTIVSTRYERYIREKTIWFKGLRVKYSKLYQEEGLTKLIES